jgi:hypothetical protein
MQKVSTVDYLKGLSHEKCVPDRNTDIYNMIKHLDVKWLQLFCASIQMVRTV